MMTYVLMRKPKVAFLMLPSRRRLRDYKNDIRPQQGFNSGIINELSVMVQNFSQQERYSVILIDEMKIQEDLVWDKHTVDLIGYVDLGDTQLNYATLKKSEEVATHMLVFLVRSIVNSLKFALANFATKNVTAVQLFLLFWKAVGILEDMCNLQVVAITSDGASSNRTMYRMHAKMERVDFSESLDDCVIYKTSNIFVDDDKHRYIFLFVINHILSKLQEIILLILDLMESHLACYGMMDITLYGIT